ncbi:hypothetical protein J5N97_006335 [Dioscorea zingiberensis]|uniref:Leucine-rich repeat-containing N-terminal plant-type domain-containing protein n=1 Tax=Dioscorea zingiberensis TaxID=325984 RepID=A0A9D5HT87_9LILI|nr:hypothetical protein J5N97_006335 [Dioscorea zingiberensis]
MSSSDHLFFFYLLLLSSMLTSTLLADVITDDDHLALLAFKNGVSSDPSGALSSWNEGHVHFCNWTGVSCARKHPNRVTALKLSELGLGGFISPSIANLSFIQSIELSVNGFSGEVPPEFGRLHRLHYLNLSFNALHGMVPVNLANCSKLRFLSLAYNQLTGSIPVELGQTLPKLEILALGNNSLTGVIPSSIGNLSSLTLLSLALNNLQGIIPEELGRLSSLINFRVSINSLNGSIPPVLFNISSLHYFSVAVNQLHGTLPPSLGAKLPKLTTLYLGGNKLSGTIPASLSNASMLQIIDPSTNKFSGTVPPVFGGMDALFVLNLEENQFQASDAKDLNFIDSLVNCSNLQAFSVAHNDLGGVLPLSIANFSKELRYLLVGYNHFSGIIPHGIGNLISLNSMDFSGNDLTGKIPEHIGNLQKLQRLGSIPEFLEDLEFLTVLDLSYNHFHGELPVKGVFGNSSAVLSVAGNGERPVDERFKDGMTMRKFVEICASHDRIMEVIDQSMFSQEQEDGDIEHGDISSLRKKIECLVSVVALGIACSVESPNDRLGMNEVAAQMHAVRDKLVEFGVHGEVKQEVSPAKLTIPLIYSWHSPTDIDR